MAFVIKAGIASTDAIIRANCVKSVKNCLSQEECVAIADRLIRDKSIPVRQEAYELKASLSADDGKSVWQQCLFDKCRSLRETATFYLRKLNCDVAALYRDRLGQQPHSLPALSGLATNGDVSDLETFVSYLKSPFASRRVEAVRGVGQVGNDEDLLRLRALLLDESSRVVRAAFQQLQPIAKTIDSDELFDSINDSKTIVGKKAILRLLMEKGKWESLKYLVEGVASSDELLAECSRKLLDETFSLNRVFTQPSPGQRKQIQDALNKSQASIESDYLCEIKFHLSSFGFEFSV